MRELWGCQNQAFSGTFQAQSALPTHKLEVLLVDLFTQVGQCTAARPQHKPPIARAATRVCLDHNGNENVHRQVRLLWVEIGRACGVPFWSTRATMVTMVDEGGFSLLDAWQQRCEQLDMFGSLHNELNARKASPKDRGFGGFGATMAKKRAMRVREWKNIKHQNQTFQSQSRSKLGSIAQTTATAEMMKYPVVKTSPSSSLRITGHDLDLEKVS